MDAKGEITLEEMAARLKVERDVRVDPDPVWRLGLTHKKDVQALEQKRARVARQRHIRITHRQPFMAHMLERIGFPDETWLKTNMARTTGWAPRGQRLVDHAPFGHWRRQAFVAAPRPPRRALGHGRNHEQDDVRHLC